MRVAGIVAPKRSLSCPVLYAPPFFHLLRPLLRRSFTRSPCSKQTPSPSFSSSQLPCFSPTQFPASSFSPALVLANPSCPNSHSFPLSGLLLTSFQCQFSSPLYPILLRPSPPPPTSATVDSLRMPRASAGRSASPSGCRWLCLVPECLELSVAFLLGEGLEGMPQPPQQLTNQLRIRCSAGCTLYNNDDNASVDAAGLSALFSAPGEAHPTVLCFAWLYPCAWQNPPMHPSSSRPPSPYTDLAGHSLGLCTIRLVLCPARTGSAQCWHVLYPLYPRPVQPYWLTPAFDS